jgi:hypothetical protein
MSTPEPYTADALWSAGEVREQSKQATGQLDVWDVLEDEDPLSRPCDVCGALPREACDPFCIGLAAEQDRT